MLLKVVLNTINPNPLLLMKIMRLCVKKYRIKSVLKVETDIITRIAESLIGYAVKLVIMCVETFN
jgi:hypothetical protein